MNLFLKIMKLLFKIMLSLFVILLSTFIIWDALKTGDTLLGSSRGTRFVSRAHDPFFYWFAIFFDVLLPGMVIYAIFKNED
jgi:hypothetical protein